MNNTKTYHYECIVSKNSNNGLLKECNFDQVMPEGPHHCPICGNFLTKKEQ